MVNIYVFDVSIFGIIQIKFTSACRGGLVGEDHGSGNRVSHFQDHKSPDGPSASNHVKLENSTSCSCDMYGYLNDQQDFQLGSIAKPSMWSPVAPVASSAGSCTTSIETNDVLDLSKNRPGTRHPPRNRANEVYISDTQPILVGFHLPNHTSSSSSLRITEDAQWIMRAVDVVNNQLEFSIILHGFVSS